MMERETIKKDDGKTHYRRVFTWDETVEEASKPNPGLYRDQSHQSCSERNPWAGTKEWDEAYNLLKSGYTANLDAVEHLGAIVQDYIWAANLTVEPELRHSVTGPALDIGAFCADSPASFIAPHLEEVSTHGRTVRLIVPTATICTTDTANYLKRGACVIVLIQLLQHFGYPLDLWAVDAATGRGGGGGRVTYATHVQRADEEIDMGRIMFAIGHTSMLRRIGFAHVEQDIAAVHSMIGLGYGQAPCAAFDHDVPPVEDGGTSIILPELTPGDDWSPEASMEWIRMVLDKIFDHQE